MTNRLARSRVHGPAAMPSGIAAAPGSPPTARVAVIGPPAAASELVAALKAVSSIEYRTETRDSRPSPTSAVLLVYDAARGDTPVPPAERDGQLREFAAMLRHWIAARGRDLEVGGLPVFLAVVTRASRPCSTADTAVPHSESPIHEGLLRQLGVVVPELAATERFGSISLHGFSVSLHGAGVDGDGKPPAAATSGIAELARAIEREATRYARRLADQEPRLRLVVSGSLLVLSVMAGLAIWGSIALWRQPRTVETAVPSPPDVLDWIARAEQAHGEGAALLRFGEWRAENGADWPTWARQCDEQVAGLRALEAEFLTLPREGGEGESAAARLRELERRLMVVRARLTLFGLVGEASPKALLRFPAPSSGGGTHQDYLQLVELTRLRWEELRTRWPDLASASGEDTALPRELPTWVARQLEQESWVNYEKLLRPVAAEVHRRVVELGQGRETPPAWSALAAGWLAKEAAAELDAWRELARLLRRLAGEGNPGDPISELQTFLARESVSISLDRVELQLPITLETSVIGEQGEWETVRLLGVKPAGGPLVVERRVSRTDDKPTRWELAARPAGERPPGRVWLFGFAAVEPTLRITFRPGDAVRARLAVKDGDGTVWQLAWLAEDSPSLVFSYAALSGPPRMWKDGAAEPLLADAANGVRLRFREPDALRLPHLIQPPVRGRD